MNVAPGAWRYAAGPLLAAPFGFFVHPLAGLGLFALGGFVLWFFRDPERSTPPSGVVAPAHGKVSVLRKEGETVRLGIFMNVWDVHVIRSPVDGQVTDVEHTPGAHRPAFSKDSDRNERVHVRVAADADDRAPPIQEVTMIAGAFARRITPYTEASNTLSRGERIGHIAFGSRVDVVFAPSVSLDEVQVSPGDKTTAGETIILDEAEPDGDDV
ncbi:phosphatidylserine decarboxylase [Halovivax asiaticus JCM 14624]|uniref:Phosphatidylserine decarboxylase n=1 Tax=Halovivax asiaticus JCM 14624 TaxID=1227490 RepID=M0BTD4_9EURY|nr:protein sorting system archaetidylserine decarboxylase [Halovivax asiaticus]ELZ14210.1 phosphatidylserine decarboxylase [Halovivax asiaticus JCM 14624]